MINDTMVQIHKGAIKAAAQKIESFSVNPITKMAGSKLITPIVKNALKNEVEPLDILDSIHKGTLEAQKK